MSFSGSGIGHGIVLDNDSRVYALEHKVVMLEAKVAHITDYLLDARAIEKKQEQIIKKHVRRINIRKEDDMVCNCLQKEMEELENIADARCTCTVAQQEGTDSTMCKSCEASQLINSIGEDLRHGLGNLKKL